MRSGAMRGFRAGAFAFFAAALAACGGAGSSMPAPNPTGSPAPHPTPTPIPTNLPSMATTVYPLPSGNEPLAGPVFASDNNLWFIESTSTGAAFVKFTATAQVPYPVPGTPIAEGATMALGSDGALWSTIQNAGPPQSAIMARTDTSGNVTTYPLPD